MTPFTDHPVCELCDSMKGLVCISKEHLLHLCPDCYKKMEIYLKK